MLNPITNGVDLLGIGILTVLSIPLYLISPKFKIGEKIWYRLTKEREETYIRFCIRRDLIFSSGCLMAGILLLIIRCNVLLILIPFFLLLVLSGLYERHWRKEFLGELI